MRRGRWSVAALVAGALTGTLGACGAPVEEGSGGEPGQLRSEIRPTDGDGWFGNGYPMGSDVTSYPSPGGYFRVWYAQKGDQAVDLTDTDGDRIPDFVNTVALSADATYKSTVIDRGFKPPLDDSVYNDGRGYGGDSRFDIYLRWVQKGSDGYLVTEACTEAADPPPDRCAGYFVMNPSFKGTSYKTERDGIEVLTSHELFHAVQSAYNSRMVKTFSEGTAVWNELQVFPRNKASGADGREGAWRDYLGFLKALFREPERAFDKSIGGGPGDSYAYATAAWFVFLTERHGPRLVREIWEGCTAPPSGDVPSFLIATETLLRERYKSDLRDEWAEFTRWNLLTGTRAPTAGGPRSYTDAAEYPEVRLEPVVTQLNAAASVEVDGLAARYLHFTPPLTTTTRLRLRVAEPRPDAVVTVYTRIGASGPLGAAAVVPGAALELTAQPGTELFAVVSSITRGVRAYTVSLTLEALASEPAPTEEDPPQLGGGCTLVPVGSAAPSPGALGGGLLALAAAAGARIHRRRRRRVS